MDDQTLESLRSALRASPDNTALLVVVVRALAERERAEEAAAVVPQRLSPAPLPPADRRLLAETLTRVGQAARALDLVPGTAPEELLARARALLALERQEEARSAYERAVAESPVLEDPTLAALLLAKRPALAEAEGRPRFRVLEGGEDPALARVVQPDAPPIRFADIGGLEEIKEQIRRRIILPFQKPSLFARFKRKAGGGILLYGPPGVGKTMLARATAGEVDARFISVAISDVLDMYIGESEQKLHALFERARASRPTVLFFDEIEALGAKRQYSRDGHGAKLVSQFLAEMDGFATDNAGVLILGATNTPWAVDPAFRRPGRFDRSFFVPPPDREARRTILALKLAGRPAEGELDLERLARATGGFSGADLENVVDTAADLAIEASLGRGNEVPISAELLDRALAEVRPSTLEWLTAARNHARYANEAGHYDEVLDFLKKHGKS